MIKGKAPEASKNQELNNTINDLFVFKDLRNENVPDTFPGDIEGEPVLRLFQCVVCKKSFKRNQGVLIIRGFFCDDHIPYLPCKRRY